MKIKISKKYYAWMAVIGFAFFIFFLSAIPDLKSTLDIIFDIILRKICHALEFGILTYLIYLALSNYKINYLKSIFIAVVLSLLYALSDEYHQNFVPGREMALIDFLVDSTGIFMAFFLILFLSKPKK